MRPVIRVENLGKRYRLGMINRHLLYEELQSWWARLRGREDPHAPLLPQRPQVAGRGDFWALKGVSFEVNEGDVVGVIGRNGSGKSTLLKILSEITTPTAGRVLIKGTVASLLEVGTGFHNELTGRENVYLNGAILGMNRDEIDAKYEEITAFAGVEEFMDTPVKRYSSGMKLRLAFAVAAHLEPEILILDEVLAVGDANFQQKCLGKIGQVAQGGRTILFVSHNMAAVQSLCNRGIVLSDGQMAFSGTASEAVSYYLHSVSGVSGRLRERKDRKGSGEVRIVGAELRDLDGKVINSVWSGQDVDLHLSLENYSSNSFPGLRIDMNVKSEMDVLIFKQHNQNSREHWGKLPGKADAVCRLRQLPLIEGNYRIDVSISSEVHGVLLDAIDCALEFQVTGSKFFGAEDLSKNKKMACVVRGDWSLQI